MRYLSMLLGICIIICGCPGIGPTPPSGSDMYCETQYDMPCTSGYVAVCISQDGSKCGYQIKGRMFYCDNCYDVEGGGCDRAAQAAVDYCFQGNNDGVLMQSEETDEDLVQRLQERLNELKLFM